MPHAEKAVTNLHFPPTSNLRKAQRLGCCLGVYTHKVVWIQIYLETNHQIFRVHKTKKVKITYIMRRSISLSSLQSPSYKRFGEAEPEWRQMLKTPSLDDWGTDSKSPSNWVPRKLYLVDIIKVTGNCWAVLCAALCVAGAVVSYQHTFSELILFSFLWIKDLEFNKVDNQLAQPRTPIHTLCPQAFVQMCTCVNTTS